MSKITITLPDKSIKEADAGSTVYDIIGLIGKGLQKSAVAAEVDGEIKGLDFSVFKNSNINVFTFDTEEGKSVFWHSASHLMAQAVKRLYPDAILAIGPSIETGFYYDIDMSKQLSPDDLEDIEREMEKIVEERLDVKGEVVSRDEAISLFEGMGEKYKVELIQALDSET
ncbi:MAG: TGS domain-containing protein, partial [Spirochaetota bacterium]